MSQRDGHEWNPISLSYGFKCCQIGCQKPAIWEKVLFSCDKSTYDGEKYCREHAAKDGNLMAEDEEDRIVWKDVSDGLPPTSDIRMWVSDDVLCQNGDGNIFIGHIRYDINREVDPLWTHSGRDMYDLYGIVKWISLKDVSKMLDKVSRQISVRFECGRDDKIGPVLGPFEWVQLTYGTLRAKLPDQEKEIDLAFIEDDEWIHDDCVWSDVVIFSASDAQKDGE